jgi:Pentapeptide repeats (8 copies)
MFWINLRITLYNLRIKLSQLDLLTPELVAFIFLVLGIWLGWWGFRNHNPGISITFSTLVPDFYANAATTLIGIAFTVLIIDALNRRRDHRLDMKRLIRNMGSSDNGIALNAVQEITETKLHWKGFLRNRHFWQANLKGAILASADLSFSTFDHSALIGAQLLGARLHRTGFWHAQLCGVNFMDADLTNADFIYADLLDARVTKKQLQSASRLLGARLPDGKIYDGSFNLPGDLLVAKAIGINVNDPVALVNFYKIPYDQFVLLSDLRKDRPEYTDWGR